MVWLLILGFAVSSSLDNLGVGISYGIRKLKISHLSNFIIALVCFLFSFSGIWFGKWISTVLPGTLPVFLGAFVLIIIGFRIVLLALPRSQQDSIEKTQDAKETKGIGALFRNPERFDLDGSKHIGFGESLILGIALSANALTNGLSAGLLGISPLAISLSAAIGSFLTVWLGVWLGERVANVRIGSFTLGQFGTLLSGIILLLIAVNNFL